MIDRSILRLNTYRLQAKHPLKQNLSCVNVVQCDANALHIIFEGFVSKEGKNCKRRKVLPRPKKKGDRNTTYGQCIPAQKSNGHTQERKTYSSVRGP